MYGSHVNVSRTWKPQIEVSGGTAGSVPPGNYQTDNYLPVTYVDPYMPSYGVVISLGRFLGIGTASAVQSGGNGYQAGLATAGKTPLTLHDGKNLKPCGMSVNNMYREGAWEYNAGVNNVKYKKAFLAELPFVLSINNAHGALFSGDKVCGYSGSTTSTTALSYVHKGKPIRWIAKSVYYTAGSASAIWQLTSTSYPGITPRFVTALDAAGAALTGVTATLAWDAVFALWTASFTGTGSGSVAQVFYEYGQNADQVAGSVQRIRSLADMLSNDDFLKWVEYAPQDYLNFPPAGQREPATQVTQETPSTITSGVSYRTLSYPISIHYAVTVEVQNATLLAADGTSTAIGATWTALPNTVATDNRGYFIGNYHTVNWRTGIIDLGANVVAGGSFGIRASYYYTTNPRDSAVIWGAGVELLTDGRNITLGSTASDYGSAAVTPAAAAGAYGTPGHLNLSDVVGALRVWVD